MCRYLSWAAALLMCSFVFAENSVEITLKDHLFYPSRIEVPAFKKVKLIIHNQDDTPEEFDSFDLNREKVIFAKRKVVIFIGPLQPGEYHFFGEYAPNTAQGTVVAVELEQP
ncbi:cupredoxin domain-containing protein [Pseudoalteromonas tunicata]|uniref:cupredoxin domain-containing protein n=1 Tax=Pseudoalteromonas tunicata TaxID=314281 RepID=UPI00351AC93E